MKYKCVHVCIHVHACLCHTNLIIIRSYTAKEIKNKHPYAVNWTNATPQTVDMFNDKIYMIRSKVKDILYTTIKLFEF